MEIDRPPFFSSFFRKKNITFSGHSSVILRDDFFVLSTTQNLLSMFFQVDFRDAVYKTFGFQTTDDLS